MTRRLAVKLSGFAGAMLLAVCISQQAPAQEPGNVPGSPNATITIDGRAIPNPPQAFGGKIETLAFASMSGIGRSGTGTLSVDGNVVATQSMPHTIPLILAWDENLDVGSNTGTPVDDGDYQVPSAFTGTIGKITLKIDRPKLTPDDIAKLKDAMAKAGDDPAPGESAGVSGTGGAGKVALRVDKLDDCRKQAEAKGLGLVDRIKFIEDCAR